MNARKKPRLLIKPRKPKNFNCYSMNWENLTCSWEPPENFVDTTYQITFKLPGRAASRKLYPCPEPAKDEVRLNRNSCTWKPKTNPIYRQPYEFYTFYINGTNVLGTWNGSYKFHHFAHVIPARPSNLTVVNKTLNSATLYWSVGYPMQNFPPGLHHRISHQSQWEKRDSWQKIEITDEPHNPNRYFNLTGLKYANSIYDVRVYVKSAVAESDEMWSNFSGITFRTPATVPGQPPITDFGSFEVTDGNNASRDVYLYWQSIPPYLENGDNFRYQVINVMENKRKVHLVPNETTRTYAKFRGLSMNNNYNFEIVSTNAVGALEIPANIFVPSKENLPKEPVAFTKIAFDNGLYELSWKPPVSGLADINNYTIFWCENDRDRPYQCQGYLDWKHVSSDTLIHNVTVPDPKRVYQFAISANTDHGSSGMMWASCTVIHNKVVGKMKTVWINRVESEAIEVGWKLDCSDRIGIVDGFRIYYCPITSPYNLTCRSPKMNKTVDNNVNSIGGRIAELKPYTTYMISVAVITKNGEGHASDPLYNTTYEARPESPRNISVTRVTNTSMTVEWEDPVHMNGVLRYYIVHYNDLSMKAGRAKTLNLTGLVPYKKYSVHVSACTVSCSNLTATTPVEVLTDIGVPDQIIPPTVRFVNSSQVRITWPAPSHAAGPLDFYQIKGVDDEIFTTTEQEALLSIPDCKSDTDEKLYKFQVRAVNVKPDGEYLYGNWSEAGEGNCYSSGPSFTVMVIIWVVGIACGIGFMYLLAYGSRKAWKKYKHMQDVDIALPPGLAPELAPDVKLLNKGEQKQRPLPPRPSSANASTGQESPSASLNSEETHMSNDSGNDEVPILNSEKMAIKSEKIASDKWDSPHLRQRNVSNPSKPGSVDTLNKRDWDVYSGKTTKSSNETLQTTVSPSQADTLSLTKSSPDMSEGVYPKLNGLSTSDYISMPRSTEMLNGHISMISPTMGLPPYCAVGMIPKSLTNKSMNAKNEETLGVAVPYVQVGLMDTFTGDLLQSGPIDATRYNLNLQKPIESNQNNQQQQSSQSYVQVGQVMMNASINSGTMNGGAIVNTTSTMNNCPFEIKPKADSTFINQQQQQQLAKELTNKLEATSLFPVQTPVQKFQVNGNVVTSIPSTMNDCPFEMKPKADSTLMNHQPQPQLAKDLTNKLEATSLTPVQASVQKPQANGNVLSSTPMKQDGYVSVDFVQNQSLNATTAKNDSPKPYVSVNVLSNLSQPKQVQEKTQQKESDYTRHDSQISSPVMSSKLSSSSTLYDVTDEMNKSSLSSQDQLITTKCEAERDNSVYTPAPTTKKKPALVNPNPNDEKYSRMLIYPRT
ncbi:hypothetical protein TKK_0000559 [Trichogramma kaykai]|uniref:Fibronectin type-III domain-containing protein n=1 Tax=Trichogramma kaykai TaxID=54128 RepID=A0ABD2W093_9HYME